MNSKKRRGVLSLFVDYKNINASVTKPSYLLLIGGFNNLA